MTIDWSGAGLNASMVSTEVATYLEKLIATGEVRPGEKLPPEREIAEKLGVSRTSVRHAMVQLQMKGLADRKPGRGTVVLEPNSQVGALLGALNQADREMLHIVDLRHVVEPSIAARAAERSTAADLLRMRQILGTSSGDLSPDESLRLDEEFHQAVARATQNPLLVALVEQMKHWISASRHGSHATREGREASIAGHQRILAAIQGGDPAQAFIAMDEHIQDVGQIVEDKQLST
ncbi:FadR family transcriptional regulator [Mycobacterium sp. 21AC1]|uniref:FadR/GntR family transcriptional regulator n=1 Tax=[Mycobacterium] appelbergii TaxID=2939269 RepID=UPI002939036A|nr:FadR/GntR family transcriptional regulator [Mycobacterium sp. 21AC1]MDV3127912.1 FadR family transcriptional regulator [Mycobacterium sp. 21AC1]